MPTILITGCSSGFGLETARTFHARGWDVVATMRRPNADLLPASSRLRIMALDVTDPENIAQTVAAVGQIDVLVNNAGFGAAAPVELTAPETAQALFATNTLGTLAMVQAVAPQMRQRRAGVIVNVSSAVTLKALPVIGVYRASKLAVDALSQSLALEMAAFGIRVHLVLPGRSPDTSFGATARPHLRGMDDADYAPLLNQFIKTMQEDKGPVTHAPDVAEAIWRAATDPATPLRIAGGADAKLWMEEAGIKG